MEGYLDFSVGKENGRVYRELKNGRVYRLLRKKMEAYTEKQRMDRVYRLLCRERKWKSIQRSKELEGYIDFSVEKEHGGVHREATNGRVYRLLCRERKWKSIQRSKELEGI